MVNPKPIAEILIILTLATIACNSHPALNPMSRVEPRLNIHEYDSTVFESVYHKLHSGDSLSQETIDSFASKVETRADFYDLLERFDKQYLFPVKYNSFEVATESRLVSWLLFPTELDTKPSKIELLKRVEYVKNDTAFSYYVFQFKTEEPHWSAKDGWMVGVVGPYLNNSQPYDWAKATFSRFSKISETSPEMEVEWIHNNVYQKMFEN
ncbi:MULTISPECIES: hypothetical protein [Niastella]|uniref:DUF4136 domain-containing protein n=1 Tax=Niastella soli TaxID=2821487 RepID=A0ABS3YZ79_9BACT|nr:hypothetical protein [Niastella soli]MBO9203220.1 hypothetical protein [Niastella soli]